MLTGSYSYGLVALSYIVAVLAAYTAFEFTRVVARHDGKSSAAWLAAGSLAMGIGIWTMHFVGMLAFKIRMPYTYDVSLTVLSMVIAITASAFAIWCASRKSISPAVIGSSGLLLGTGITAMHYTGMAAMQMDGTITYEPFIYAASIGIAIITATASVSIIYSIVHSEAKGPSSIGLKVAAALVMGLAICGMHYTGMAAARYEANPGAVLLDAPASSTSLSIFVAVAALIILGVSQLTIFFDLRITAEQRRMREAQRRALHLNELLDSSSNEILVVDLESLGIVNANQRSCTNLGYSLAELTSMSVLEIVADATERSVRERIATLVDDEEKHLYVESTRVRADGSVYPVKAHLQCSMQDGAPYLLVFATDITARRNLEERLDLAKEYESIGRLTAGVTQEISQPAAEIGDNIQFLKEAMTEALDLIDVLSGMHLSASKGELTADQVEEVGDMLKTVNPCYLADEIPLALQRSLDGVSRISSLLRALKDFSDSDGKGFELTDLNKSVQNTVTVTSSEWKYIAALDTDLDSDLPLIPCRPREISQVLLILLINAAQAIERRLQANPDAPTRIEITTRARRDYVEISVSDTGAGIPPNVGKRVYDPRLTTRDVGNGGGQGLAIARSTVVDGHGGMIEYTSSEGQGTTFTISLPIEAQGHEAKPTANVAA